MRVSRFPLGCAIPLHFVVTAGLALWLFFSAHTAFAQTPHLQAHPTNANAQTKSITQIQSDNFTFLGALDEDNAAQLITDLEQFRAAMRDIYNIKPARRDQHIRIIYISDPEFFAAQSTATNFAAYYLNSDLGPEIVINGSRPWSDKNLLKSALLHEYVHHFNIWHVDYNLPRWLNEGLAEYYATLDVSPDGQGADKHWQYKLGAVQTERLATLQQDSWLPMSVLLDSMHSLPDTLSRYDASLGADAHSFFYAQSWIIVHYLQNTPGGMDKMEGLVRALDPSPNFDALFKTYFGQSPEGFLENVKTYAKGEAINANVSIRPFALPAITTAISHVDARTFDEELYLLTSPVKDIRADQTRAKLAKRITNNGGPSAAIYAGDALAYFRSLDFHSAQENIDIALSLDDSDPRFHVLAGFIAFYDWQEGYAKPVTPHVQEVLRNAIKAAPDYPELRSFFIVTHGEEHSASGRINSDALSALTYLMDNNYPVMNPNNAPTLFKALLALKRYDDVLNILDITQRWSQNPERRLSANRLRYDIEREKRRADINE